MMEQRSDQNNRSQQAIWTQIRQQHRLPLEWTSPELLSTLPDGYCSDLARKFRGLSDGARLAAIRRIPGRHLESMMVCLLDESAGLEDLLLISRILLIRMKPRLARLSWFLLQQQPENRFLVSLCGQAARYVLKSGESRYPLSLRLIRHPKFQNPAWAGILAEGLDGEDKTALSNVRQSEQVDQHLIPLMAQYYFTANPPITLDELIKQMELLPDRLFLQRLCTDLFLRFDAAALKENEAVLLRYFQQDPPETAAILSRYLTFLEPADYDRAICAYFLDRFDFTNDPFWQLITAPACEKMVHWRHMVLAQDWLQNNPVKWKSFQPYIMKVDKVYLADDQQTLYLYFDQVVIRNTVRMPLSALLIPRKICQSPPEAGFCREPAVPAQNTALNVKDVILAENINWRNTQSLIALMRRGETDQMLQVNFDHIAVLYAHQVLRELLQ
ncbi:MAG: hypothetical protein VB070_13555 [Clostridiaceae bacterium]|nr:hypothetical protein [Clostridiaceae bacterium]